VIEYLIIHSTGTESGYIPEKKEYVLSVSCDIIHYNGQLSKYKSNSNHPSSKENYKHIAYVGGLLNNKPYDTATWRQYDSMEYIIMYHLLYNQHLKIGSSELFFNENSGIKLKSWLKGLNVNNKNIM